jgi:hypothetical protein
MAEWPETSIWKGVTIAACFAAVCAAALTWQAHKAKVTEQRFAERAKAYRARADQGDAKAESDLAYLYSHGQGVPQDYDEALRLRRKAADQGYADGEVGLGYMYIYGQGVPQDYAEALRWCRKAADHGYAKAEYNLGEMYYYGRGVPQDRAEAVRWYQKAADQGDEHAQRVLHIKWKGMSTVMEVGLAVGFLGSLLLLAGSLTPGGSFGGGNQRKSALTGMLVLSSVVLDLLGFRYIGILTPMSAYAAFQLGKGLLTGTTVAFLLLIVLPNNLWPKIAKVGLGLLGVLCIGGDLLLVANYKPRSAVLTLRSFWSLNGMLPGMIVSLAIVHWLATRSRREAEQQ